MDLLDLAVPDCTFKLYLTMRFFADIFVGCDTERKSLDDGQSVSSGERCVVYIRLIVLVFIVVVVLVFDDFTASQIARFIRAIFF